MKTTGKPQLERRERRSKQNDTAEAKNKGIHTVQVIQVRDPDGRFVGATPSRCHNACHATPQESAAQSMENLLLRVQANVAKEFEVEKDVVTRRNLVVTVGCMLVSFWMRLGSQDLTEETIKEEMLFKFKSCLFCRTPKDSSDSSGSKPCSLPPLTLRVVEEVGLYLAQQ